MLRPALYDKCPSGAIPKPGTDAIVSNTRTKITAVSVSTEHCVIAKSGAPKKRNVSATP
jgi:hypothetical protein